MWVVPTVSSWWLPTATGLWMAENFSSFGECISSWNWSIYKYTHLGFLSPLCNLSNYIKLFSTTQTWLWEKVWNCFHCLQHSWKKDEKSKTKHISRLQKFHISCFVFLPNKVRLQIMSTSLKTVQKPIRSHKGGWENLIQRTGRVVCVNNMENKYFSI